jgi:hypothetical protein
MCIICTGLKNNTLTPWEAAANLMEMRNSIEKEHFEELSKEINERLWLERVNICIFCAKIPCACILSD